MSGGKGGSTSSSVEIPAWLENAAIENINRARDVQKIGYTPYYGPEVAAFSPMQQQAMQATGSAASAFGLAPQGFDAMAGMPQAQEFAGGLMGYSSAPLYEQSVDALRQKRPAQAMAIEGQFIDPYTGQYSAPNYAPTVDQIAQAGYTARDAAAAQASQEAAAQRKHEADLARWNAMQDHSTNINVDTSLTGGSMTYDTEQGPITINPEMGFNPVFDPTVDASMVGGTVTGGSMNMDQGPVTVQTETGPVTVDPTMTFDPSLTGGTVSYTDSSAGPTYSPVNEFGVGGEFAGVPTSTGAVTSAYEFPNITSEPLVNGQFSDPNDPQWDYSDFGGNSNLYSDPAEEWLMSQPVTPAYNPVNEFGSGGEFAGTPVGIEGYTLEGGLPPLDYPTGQAQPLQVGDMTTAEFEQLVLENGLQPNTIQAEQFATDNSITLTDKPPSMAQPAITSGGGLVPPTDMGLMDVVQTGMNATPTSLIAAALTGSGLNPNTAPVPVEDFSSHRNDLPPVATPVANPLSGTYNQAYWADKVASGVSQADMAAEQAAIANAGGKVYKGTASGHNPSTGVQVNNTTGSSGSGK